MSRRLLKQRLADMARRLGAVPPTFFALSREDVEGFPPLNMLPGQACIKSIIDRIGGVDLIIFDSVMCLLAGLMTDEEAWQQVMPWVRDLTRSKIAQIWVHHTGHNTTRGFGTSTREWQLDTVLVAEAVERESVDISFRLKFSKARERTPATRAEFEDVNVALVHDRWEGDAAETGRAGHVSPLGLKFLDALHNVLASGVSDRRHGRPAATRSAWWDECVKLGLIDPDTRKPAQSLFNKHRRELIAANRIACDEDLTWTL
jgi:hypothetical protein